MLYIKDLYGQDIEMPDLEVAIANAIALTENLPDPNHEADMKAYQYWIDMLEKLRLKQHC